MVLSEMVMNKCNPISTGGTTENCCFFSSREQKKGDSQTVWRVMVALSEQISHLLHVAGESIPAAKPGEAISLPRFPVYSILTPPADKTVQTHIHAQAFTSQLLPQCNFHCENLNWHNLHLSGKMWLFVHYTLDFSFFMKLGLCPWAHLEGR